MMPGIPKFWKESHPERAKDNEDQFFTYRNWKDVDDWKSVGPKSFRCSEHAAVE